MERWRSFFSKAGEDVWTIIEQAILLAAHDHPREFKEKRCDIAETLFAARHNQGDPDSTRLSASVITNCINQTDVSEARGNGDAVEVHTKVQDIHDAGQHHTGYCSAEAQDGGIDTNDSLFTKVCSIKETLDDSMQPDGAVLCGLRKLESLHISVDVLKESEIGKQVNNLRKHPCKEIRLLARGLVRCWKELVDDWVNRAGTPVDLRGEYPTSERDHVEQERFSTLCDRDTRVLRKTPADVQRHYNDSCLEGSEERGGYSRAELAGLGGIGRLAKSHFNPSHTTDRVFLQDRINVGVEGQGRKCSNGRASVLNRDYGVGKLLTEKSNADKPYGGYGSQNLSRPAISLLKLPYDERLHSEEVLVTGGKRKHQDCHIQMDKANSIKDS